MNLPKGQLQSQSTEVNGLRIFDRRFAGNLPEDAPAVILVQGWF